MTFARPRAAANLGRGAWTPLRRQLLALGLTSILVVAILAPGAPAGGQTDDDEFVAGSGRADARVVQVGPMAGQLSLAPTIGVSLADYQSSVGRGEALVFDWVALEDSIPDEFHERFPSARVDSRDEGAAEGQRITSDGAADGSPVEGGVFERFARADDAPLGESYFRTSGLSIPGVIEISSGVAQTSAGIVRPEVREARARTEIGRVDIGDGALALKGLRWDSVQRTGAEETATGSFSLGGLEVGGVEVPVPEELNELQQVFDQVNGLLEPSGLILEMPALNTTGGLAEMTSLSIRISESPAGREHLGPVVGELQPIREPILDNLLDAFTALHEESDEQIPNFTSLVLVADIAMGVVTGSSTLRFDLGGTLAFTEGVAHDNPFGAFTPLEIGDAPPASVQTETVTREPATSGIGDGEGRGDGSQSETFTAAPQRAGEQTIPGIRGGLALIVGAAGILAALAMAAVDLYWMRRSTAA